MNTPVFIASGNPLIAAALAETLREAGFACAEKPVTGCIHLCDADAPAEAGTPALYLANDLSSCPQPALKKPVRRTELVARLQQMAASGAETIRLNEAWRLNAEARQLSGEDGTVVRLTEKETQLIACLLEGSSVSRQKLLSDVWGLKDGIDTHTLETHLYRLRAKLKPIGGEGWIVATDDGYKVCA